MPEISLEAVRRAMALAEPDFNPRIAQLRMSPRPRPLKPVEGVLPRQAATLLLLYPHQEGLHFLLTRRSDAFRNHAGQISLPGGRQEQGESLLQTALRETCEEVGVCAEDIEILGELTDLYIPPSNFQVQPFVGYSQQRPTWQQQATEVTELIETPLHLLLDDSLKKEGATEIRGNLVDIFWYEVQGHQVWGATAIMLSEMEWRLRTVLSA